MRRSKCLVATLSAEAEAANALLLEELKQRFGVMLRTNKNRTEWLPVCSCTFSMQQHIQTIYSQVLMLYTTSFSRVPAWTSFRLVPRLNSSHTSGLTSARGSVTSTNAVSLPGLQHVGYKPEECLPGTTSVRQCVQAPGLVSDASKAWMFLPL